MADLAAADVAVSIPSSNRDFGGVHTGKNLSIATLTFGDGSKTYPAGGIPMPAIGQFGYRKALDFVAVEPPPGNGFVYKFDRANHKLKIFTQGITTGSTAATTSGNGALVENSAAAETAARMPNTAIDTTYDFGPLKEMAATIAPAAVSLTLFMAGE